MKHLGDITKLNGAEIPVVDCITGGSPCQDLSVAGKRAGLDGERSGLFMEQIRIVKEMRKKEMENGRTAESVRPRWMVWENVPGAFSSNGGKDFQAVLTEIVRIVEPECADVPMPKDGKWSKAGCLYDELGRWSIAWRVHDAQFWGVPQRRKRIALVADFGGLSAPEILFERNGLSRNSEPCGEAWQETAGGTGEGVEGAIVYNGGNITSPINKTQPLPGDPCHTLTADDRNYLVYESHAMDARYNDMGEICCTLGARLGTGGNNLPLVVYGFDRYNQVIEKEIAQPLRSHDGGDETPKVIVDTMHDQQTILCGNPWDPQSERVFHGDGAWHSLAGNSGGGQSRDAIHTNEIVRRLTPLECERLQGFPDGWTDIGEWVDTKGKKHKEADSPRYKALGNSIALPFWFYLLRRISATYERPATLGSLFDGIGGFPLCWERCNGKGTAIWASEIEEFPIAVTKIRFPE